MVAVRALGVMIFVVALSACQKQNSAPVTETRPAMRAANGTLYDLKCMKGKKPQNIKGCAVSETSVKKAWGDSYYSSAPLNYYIWQVSYFEEMALCQWLFGLDACYNYFGITYQPGPRCDVRWLDQFNDLPTQNGCGWYANQWPRQNPSYPRQPQYSCESIKAERDWLAQASNYCTYDAQCGDSYTVAQWGGCSPTPINPSLRSPELDYWVGQYQSQCLSLQGNIYCPMVACSLPKCVQGRCQSGCN